MRDSRQSCNQYALLDIESTQPLPCMRLSREDVDGIAVLVRRKGKPLYFWMEALPGDKPLTAKELEQRIIKKSGTALVKAAIRDEMRPPVKPHEPPSITVAICTKDRTGLLSRCLRSLRAMDPVGSGGSLSLEVLVVDNAPSTKDTETIVSSCPGVRYIVEPRPGLDFARNRALREARGDLVAYIDDDVVVDKGWLAGLMEAWNANPDAAAFTGQVLPLELTTRAQIIFEKRGGFRRGFDPVRYGAKLDNHPAYPCSAGVFGTGANMVFQKQILKDLNGFDEALDTGPPLPAAGDHDIFYRLIRTGHTIVYAPDLLVFHEHRRGLWSLTRQYWSWGLGVMTHMDKIRRTDPALRKTRRYLLQLWFNEHLIELTAAMLRQKSIPCYMVLAEMAGGVIGLFGGYDRSVKRMDRILNQAARLPTHDVKPEHGLPVTQRSSLTPAKSTNPPTPLPKSNFKPWEILHLDLRQGVMDLAGKKETGGIFVVFWWRDIPLGQHWIRATRLPMSSADLRECAITAIEPALRHGLLETSRGSSWARRSPGACRLNLKTLGTLDRPLQQLEENLSLPDQNMPCPTVSVVVCTRDRPGQLKQCLASLQEMSLKPGEIVLVDSAPQSDATRHIVRQFPGVRYIQEPRAGLDVARNTGIRNTTGEIVAFTDDDAVAHPDWIARICQGFKNPDVMAVTGLVLPAKLETRAQFLFETHWGFGRGYAPRLFGGGFFEKTRRRGVPAWEIGAGANMAFRRAVFERVGLFDERLDVGAAGCSGDSEMWYRILAEGWACRYEPAAVVYHHHRKEMRAFNRQIFYYMRGHIAALLIQFQRYGHWGNIRRLFIGFPTYYGRLALDRLLHGPSERASTLAPEIRGCLSGVLYYFSNRRAGTIT